MCIAFLFPKPYNLHNLSSVFQLFRQVIALATFGVLLENATVASWLGHGALQYGALLRRR